MDKRLMRATPIYWAGFLYALLRHLIRYRLSLCVWSVCILVYGYVMIQYFIIPYIETEIEISEMLEELDKLEAETNKFTKELDEFVKSSSKFYFPRKASCHDWVDIDALCMDSDDNTMWIGTGTGIREPSSEDEIYVVSRGDPFIVRYNGRTYKMLDFGDKPKG